MQGLQYNGLMIQLLIAIAGILRTLNHAPFRFGGRGWKTAGWVLLLMTPPSVFSQPTVQEYEAQLEHAKDSEKPNLLMVLAEAHADKKPKKVLEYGERALPLFQRFPDQKAESKLRNLMSAAWFHLGDYERALSSAHLSADLANQIGDRDLLTAAINLLGTIHASRGEYDRALAYYSEALEASKALGHRKTVASVLNNMSIVYKRLSDLDRALDLSHQALKIQQELGEKKSIARSLNNIATIYHALGSRELSLKYMLKSLALKEEVGEKLTLSPTLNNIGELQLELGNYEKALAYLNRSLEIKKSLGAQSGIAISLAAIGNVYLKMEDFPRARDHFLRALEIQNEIKAPERNQTHLYLGSLYRRWGRLEDARIHVDQALLMAEACNIKSNLRDGYIERSRIQEAQNNFQGALASYRQYQELDGEIIDEETRTNVGRIRTRYEADQRARELALLKKDNEIQTLEVARQKLFRNIWILGTTGMTLLIGLVLFHLHRRVQQRQLERTVEARTRELVALQQKIVESAHRAGMAELAIEVLHHAGNSLNSVHTSAGMLLEILHQSKPLKVLDGIVGLIDDQQGSLGAFQSKTRKGQAIPEALVRISDGLNTQQAQLLDEATHLQRGLQDIQNLIQAQIEYVGVVDDDSPAPTENRAPRPSQDSTDLSTPPPDALRHDRIESSRKL